MECPCLWRGDERRAHQSRACAYGIPGVTVDGNDLLAVYDAVSQRRAARAGEGRRWSRRRPSLVPHSKSDRTYRTRDEVREWQQRDPIPRFAQTLIAAGLLDEAEAAALHDRACAAVEASVAFAEASPEPAVETLMEGVYA